MARNYVIEGVTPVIIAIQGVKDKLRRRELERKIEDSLCEWREPDFFAADQSDILSDDVTHLFEGEYIQV